MTKEDIFEVIQQNIMEVLEEIHKDMVQIDKSMKDLGANSVDRMEIIAMTMEALDVKIPLVEFGSVKNIQGLVDLLYEKRNNSAS